MFILRIFTGIIKKFLYTTLFLFVLYIGFFGLETPRIEPFITNWVSKKVDEKKQEIKQEFVSSFDSAINKITTEK